MEGSIGVTGRRPGYNYGNTSGESMWSLHLVTWDSAGCKDSEANDLFGNSSELFRISWNLKPIRRIIKAKTQLRSANESPDWGSFSLADSRSGVNRQTES